MVDSDKVVSGKPKKQPESKWLLIFILILLTAQVGTVLAMSILMLFWAYELLEGLGVIVVSLFLFFIFFRSYVSDNKDKQKAPE